MFSLKNETYFNQSARNKKDGGPLQGSHEFLHGVDESDRYDEEAEDDDDDVSNESVAERKILKIDRRLTKNR